MSRRRHQTGPGHRQDIINSLFKHGFPYSRKLTAHTSCVNYMAFSLQGARYLATGGDDLDIQIWDLHQEELVRPRYTCVGPRQNIFTLAFSATNKYLFAGGTDNTIYKYDVTCLDSLSVDSSDIGRAKDRLVHRDIVRSISCHPSQENIFLSASDDGCIVRHDQRTSAVFPCAQDIIALDCSVTDVKWHPTLEHIFVTSEEKGGVCLRDDRMGFGPNVQRTREGVVQRYNTNLSKGSVAHLSNPEPSSVAFDSDGTKLVVTLLNHYPTVYALKDPNPIAVCMAQNLPDGTPVPSGQRTYTNSCTMKHGSFGALGLNTDNLYCAGSDDFCAYLWNIPAISTLVEERQVVRWDDWSSQSDVIGYADGLTAERYIPKALETPFDRLRGHRSIVNSTLMHPSFPFILTCGIERHILLHSPTAHVPFSDPLERTPLEVRTLGSDTTGFDPFGHVSDTEDESTIALFDHILVREGDADPFVIRKYAPDDEESEDEEIDDDDDMGDDGHGDDEDSE